MPQTKYNKTQTDTNNKVNRKLGRTSGNTSKGNGHFYFEVFFDPKIFSNYYASVISNERFRLIEPGKIKITPNIKMPNIK